MLDFLEDEGILHHVGEHLVLDGRGLSRPRRSACAPPRATTWSSSTPADRTGAARDRRGRHLRRADAGPHRRDLHPRGPAVSRRTARLGREEGVRPPGRGRLLHRRQPLGARAGDRAVQRRRAVGAASITARCWSARSSTQFKKIKLHTHENVGWGKVHLPEEQMHTSAYWLSLPPDISGRMREAELQGRSTGLANVLRNIAPLYLMCDPRDLASIRRCGRPSPIGADRLHLRQRAGRHRLQPAALRHPCRAAARRARPDPRLRLRVRLSLLRRPGDRGRPRRQGQHARHPEGHDRAAGGEGNGRE